MKSIMAACRACMTEISSPPDVRDQQPLVLDMFSYCTNIQIAEEEKLPKNFCAVCIESIQSCYGFIQQARETDATMRGRLSREQTSVIIERESIPTPALDPSKTHHKLEMDEYTNYYDLSEQYTMKDGYDQVEISPLETYNHSPSIQHQGNNNINVTVDFEIKNVSNSAERQISKDTKKMKISKPTKSKIKEKVLQKQPWGNCSRQCPKCKKMFVSKTWFNKHLASEHADTVFSCTICPRGFTRRHSLKQHMVTHSAERPFACHLCPKRFKMRKQLNLHQRMHRQTSLYMCDHCRMSFKIKGVLVTHMKVHEDEKVNLCDLCGAQFTQAGNLAVHMRTHTGEKPYSCARCSFRCAVRSSLRRHERRHDGARPHACRACGKRFLDTSSLSRHVRTHTGELPYRCGLCSQAFIDSWKRKSHIMKQHNVAFGDVPPAPATTTAAVRRPSVLPVPAS